MGFIIKNTSGLINSKFTDVGRRKLSQGLLDIRYFQIGDSEVCYDCAPIQPITNHYVLEAEWNAQNNSGVPQSNKQHVKYPFYLDGNTGTTYGIPFPDSAVEQIFNTASPRGFFSADTNAFTAFTSSAYTITSNFYIDGSTGTTGNTCIDLIEDFCSATTGTPSVGDFITIYWDGQNTCGEVLNQYPILTYKIQEVYSASTGITVCLDRPVPDFLSIGCTGNSRALIYPSGMTVLYDTVTPLPQWEQDAINFETPCDLAGFSSPIWNMNIPWSVSPAGLFSNIYRDYQFFGSVDYLGTKEYLGYQSSSGQTFVDINGNTATTQTYYYNSFDEIIDVEPEEQKAIAIVHYTNNGIDNFYGEKFATEPVDPNDPNAAGQARNFKVTIPWLMWHKSNTCTIGEIFYIDPPGFDDLELFEVNYMASNKNNDMNEPGMRYYQLWDTNPNSDGYPNRVGKVYPDQKIIVFDDEEIVAAMSYKSNRNWTLPAPKVGLITPNVCEGGQESNDGVLSAETEYMWITYRFNSTAFTDSLHCNYYTKIQGPATGCTTGNQNVSVRFGDEFCFLKEPCSGYSANEFVVLAQKVIGNTLPNPEDWVAIDFTDKISGSSVNDFITSSGMTGTTFVIDTDRYNNGTQYNLADHLRLPVLLESELMNFGDEYYFYGNVETDIAATIYEMRFAVNLIGQQFTNSTNPTSTGTPNYITEIGLYDLDLDLIVISKLQSPVLRQGSQQFLIKLDF
jgi:hypothetical protein